MGGDIDQSRFDGLFGPSGVSIPSLDSSGIDLSDLRNTLSPRISPSSAPDRSSGPGQLHHFKWDINGETVARGRGDDELLDSLGRSSVRDRQRSAGKDPYWYGA